MTSQQEKILKIAAGEIGYSRHTDKLKGTKYARETQPALWPKDKWLLENGVAYCDIGVTWVFWKAGLLDILPGKQSYNVDYRTTKARQASALINKYSAKPGDVLVFDWNWKTASCDHVGILEKYLGNGVYQTIEFNTSPGNSGSQGNGGGVYRRTRKASQIRHVIRPKWSDDKVVVNKPVVKKPTPAKTSNKIKVDGRFGKETVKVLQTFLNKKGAKLTVDGKAGISTWKALQKFLKAPVIDGYISHQSYKPEELGNGITTGWRYTGRNSKGSKVVKVLQKWVGVKADGVWYEGTTKALQEKLNSLM